ncbi:hypothetical protein [Streptomyces abyssomicinicus]|uniref:hypothetical protein n=1 Tax=Streptomyces abyssomicinicus TaxID=574929 RepID=UPI001250B214|nr:hypothetical protein [Streptomyces abyssomicinicus]
MAAPQRMVPPPPADDEDEPEVTRASVERERRRKQQLEAQAAKKTMTRRSWYTEASVADAFQRAVDDIHHSTRVPKHEVVAALLEAAVAQADRVQRKLGKGDASHG